MDPLSQTLEVFEGESHRIVWLPPITLGYIFILSGNIWHFAFAVLSIGGGRVFSDLLTSDWLTTEKSESDVLTRIVDNWISNLGSLEVYTMGLTSVIYAISAIWGIKLVYQYFTHTNPVIVGLAGIYWGILVVVILNMSS